MNENVLPWENGNSNDHADKPKGLLEVLRSHPKNPAKRKSFLDELLSDPVNAKKRAQNFIGSGRFAGAGSDLDVPIRELDVWLTARNNRATPNAVAKAYAQVAGVHLAQAVAAPEWRAARERVFNSLLAVVVAGGRAALGAELTRLLLLFGLIESLAMVPSPIANENDVENALRYRAVLIPKELLTLVPRRARLARRYGFADLFVVRDEWSKYEAGEIAHIENVLPHESKKRFLTTLSETETTTSTETESVDIEEHDSQTTDRMEMQQHAQTETNLAVHVAAQVEVQASYGPMEIAATAGGSFDYSHKDAEEHAFQQSHEMVSRAVKRVEERVKTSRSTRALQRTTEMNRHALQNETDEPVVGVYRWVDKIQRLQLFRYPHRLLLEFEIPEPAAYLIWRRKQPRDDVLTPEPTALVKRDKDKDFEPIEKDHKTIPLQPSDITVDTYEWWVSQYNVVGVEEPPPPTLSVTTVLELKQQIQSGESGGGGGGGNDEANPSTYDKSYFDLVSPGGSSGSEPGVTLPRGYRLDSWRASGYATDVILVQSDGSYIRGLPNINVMVGNESVDLNSTVGVDTKDLLETDGNPWGFTLPIFRTWVYSDGLAVYDPPARPVTGSVPVTALATQVRECRIHVTLYCVRMYDALQRWQQQTYEQIAAAYWALKRQRADELAAAAIGTGIEIKGDSPGRNKEVIVEELKRGVIEMLTGQNFRGRDAMKALPTTSPPEVALDTAISYAEEIQFIEQAFEWENLTYVLYPYFWARQSQWNDLADLTLPDPEFARFLRSGSARVVVPARPKLENQVTMYVDFGALWGGGPIPTVNDPDYLSIAAEIIAQQTPPDDGEKRRSWDVRLPTTLVWLDSDSTLPKTNPEPNLDNPPGVVAP